ncbi:MAG: response regulator transcription factor [Pseudomonadota bacterium]
MSEKTAINIPENPETSPHILVVDDDDRIRDLVTKYLRKQDFMVSMAENAQEAKEILALFEYDLMVLDVMMPGETGFEFTEKLRESSDMPVILLTALGETDDRIEGLTAGADDYLTKPFDPRELVLRIEAILRRRPTEDLQAPKLQIGPWFFDPDYNELKADDRTVKLTDGEMTLLRALAQKAGELYDRESLSEECGFDSLKRTIDVQITRLRRKLEDNSDNPRYLQTVRGKGYILRAEKLS